MKPGLRLVGLTAARIMQVRLDTLRLQAERLFPASSPQAERWVQAKLYIADRKPAVKIGAARVDTSRAARSLREVGHVEIPLEIPHFIRRFMRPQ